MRDIENLPSSCEAYECHITAPLTDYPPASGKHTAHLEAGYVCENCHMDYIDNTVHKNGILDGNLDSISGNKKNIIIFDESNSQTTWDTQIAGCMNIICHFGSTSQLGRSPGPERTRDLASVAWYGDSAGCTACHVSGSSIDPLSTNGSGADGKHVSHVEQARFGCEACHSGYKSQSTHMNGVYGKNESDIIIYYDSINPSASWNDSTAACENMSCHGNAEWYTTDEIGCTICHYPGRTTGAVDPMTTNGSGSDGKHIAHVTERGFSCEKCHSGYRNTATHSNGVLDTIDKDVDIALFDATNPTGDWINDTGLGTGSCALLACHGGSTLEWYGGSWTLPPCSECHKSSIGLRRQVFDSNGDGTGTGGDFNKESHHVIDYDNPGNQIVTESDCLICHNQENHMIGTVRLNDKDNAGQVIIYDSADPSTLEPFCLSCHDSDGALAESNQMSPFSSVNTLGVATNFAGDKTKQNWLKTYGHGSNGSHAPYDKLTCVGTGEPGTGCHGSNGSINAHGSVYKVIATKEYNYPLISGYYSESWFSLCFDCHSNYPGITKEDTLGVKENGILDNEAWLDYCTNCHSYNPTENAYPPYHTSGVTTHFADHDEPGDPWGLNDGQIQNCGFLYPCMPTDNNLHWLHLGMYDSGTPRGSSMSLVVCSNCHSVHGSNMQYGAVHDEMGYINTTDGNGNTYGRMRDEAYGKGNGTPNYLAPYPTYCIMSCHEGTFPTRAWFSPIDE